MMKTENVHSHWCLTCSTRLLMPGVLCERLKVVPRCPQCGGDSWADLPDVYDDGRGRSAWANDRIGD